jgi:HPt (histidine-containing phosphotransfer) domain-containing protein
MKSTMDAKASREAPLSSVMDVADALERLGDDHELLREIVQIYVEDAPAIVDRIHAAVKAEDAPAVQHSSHSLKGLASSLSAHEVVGAAARLEHLGASHNLDEVQHALEEVDQRVEELNTAIQEFLKRR